MRSEQSDQEQEDEEWRLLRRANCRKLLMFPAMMFFAIVAWIIWFWATDNPAYTR
jgi:hypothetical protein